jgi:hypothetical protein
MISLQDGTYRTVYVSKKVEISLENLMCIFLHNVKYFQPVFQIRSRNIRKFLCLPDPAPSIIKQK